MQGDEFVCTTIVIAGYYCGSLNRAEATFVDPRSRPSTEGYSYYYIFRDVILLGAIHFLHSGKITCLRRHF